MHIGSGVCMFLKAYRKVSAEKRQTAKTIIIKSYKNALGNGEKQEGGQKLLQPRC